jgi:hypothetical protein
MLSELPVDDVEGVVTVGLSLLLLLLLLLSGEDIGGGMVLIYGGLASLLMLGADVILVLEIGFTEFADEMPDPLEIVVDPLLLLL